MKPSLIGARRASPNPTHRMPLQCTVGSSRYQLLHETRGKVSCLVPQLRLAGRWLEACGFRVGDVLTVTVEPGKVVLSRREPAA